MATVIVPGSDQVQASFAPVAKHYGVGVDPCPPRRGNRKGVVEKMIDYLTQSWWRTARVGTIHEAQVSLDRWCVEVADHRFRDTDTSAVTVGEAAASEALLALPAAAFPVTISIERIVSNNALVSVWGNRYSVSPGLVGTTVTVTHRHGANTFEIRAAGRIVVEHRLAPAGAHRTVRLAEHTEAFQNVVLGQFTSARPCATKLNRPPSPIARAIAGQLAAASIDDPVIDLDIYRRLVEGETS